MIYKNLIISGIFLSLLVGCQNSKPSDGVLKKKPSAKSAHKKRFELQERKESQNDSLSSEITSFMEENNYVVQYQADGFLNNDKFKDKVLILQEDEQYKSLARLTLVLLGKKQGYKLYKESYTVMPAEYTAENYKIFDVEDVQIQNHKIAFDLSSAGPNGNISYEFIFQNGKLELHEFNGYFMGAGSHTEYVYKSENPTNGVLKETVINTLQDDMTSETKSYHINLTSPANFENFDYEKFLSEITKQTE